MPTLTQFWGRNGRAPTEIEDRECTTCQNWFFSGHSLQLRGGRVETFTDGLSTQRVRGLHRANVATPFWMWSVGSKIRSDRTGSQASIWDLLVSDVTEQEFIEANGSVYIANAANGANVLKSDGTVAGTVAHPSANVPDAAFGVWVNKRLFLNDAANTSRVWFSDTNDPDTFRNQSSATVATEGGWIDVSKGDGASLTAFGVLGSALFVFKDNSLHLLAGTSFTGSEEFRLIEIARGVGTRSRRSVVAIENGLMFLDTDGLVKFFYGPAKAIISEIGRPVEDLTRAISSTGRVVAFAHDRKYFVSFTRNGSYSPTGNNNDEAWALDTRLIAPYLNEPRIPSGWSELTGLAWSSAYVTRIGSDQTFPYVGDASTAAGHGGKVWKFLSGTTDDGSAISYAWISKAYGAGTPTTVRSISEITTLTRTMSAAVTHEAYANLASTATATKSITPSSTTHSVNTWRPGETVRGTVLQVGVSGSSSVGGEILAVDWDWTPKRKEPVDA